jgi:20S proteasome subunit alpha 7
LAGSGSRSPIGKKSEVSHKISGPGSGQEVYSATRNPEGHLFQEEYATKVVDRESTAVGFRCSDGVLFATKTQINSPQLTPGANPRIFWLGNQIACATVGDRPDCCGAVAKAREYDRPYFSNFGIHLSVQHIVGQTSVFFHCKHSGGGLSYGTTLLFGGYNGRPQLCALEPSGHYFHCFGNDRSLGRAELQRTEWRIKTVLEAVPLVADVIKALPHQQNKKWNIEMLWICEPSNGKPESHPGFSSDRKRQ